MYKACNSHLHHLSFLSLPNLSLSLEMASNQQQSRAPQSLYPKVVESNPEIHSPFASSAPNSSRSPLYPSVDMNDLAVNLFPDADDATAPPPIEEALLRIPGAVLHLIDRSRSVELASGDLTVVRLHQGDNTIAVLVRVGGAADPDAVQWPLARDEAAVKLDESHYFFSLHVPHGSGEESSADELLNYGLTFASKGQEALLKELDGILERYNSFSIEKVEGGKRSKVLDGLEVSPAEVSAGPKKAMMEERSGVYWTTLAPNVEDYGGLVAKGIAMGSGQVIKGILWCGDVTVDRLKWGEDLLKRRMNPNSSPTEISRDAMKRMKRVKTVTKMSEKVATGILSGVVKVSGFFIGPVVNSAAGKKFFSLLPGEIVLATLDGFGKICDAVEVAGKNVLQTTSVVTTGVTSHRYGEQAGEITHQGLGAAGHAFGTAWAVFKIRKALNPKSAMKPTSLAKSTFKAAAAEIKGKKSKK